MANVEVAEVHTRLLRLALGVEDSRAYWENLDPTVPPGPRAIQAFEQRWFGTKSLERVRTLLANFGARYDEFPSALAVLQNWRGMTPSTRQMICHWHLQLSDPLYRSFTASFLAHRRLRVIPSFDRDVVVRWINENHPNRWSASTVLQFARKLLSAATEAGLIASERGQRTPQFPRVPDEALEFLLYLLRETTFSGSLLENPYLSSVGLIGDLLDQRLRKLPSLDYHRMGELTEFDWKYKNLTHWAKETL